MHLYFTEELHALGGLPTAFWTRGLGILGIHEPGSLRMSSIHKTQVHES